MEGRKVKKSKKVLGIVMILALLVFSIGCGSEPEEATRITNDEPAAAEPEAEPAVVEEEPAVSSDKVITSVADPWPPFIDPDSPTMGMSLEIVSAAFAVEGYEVKHEIMPWARALEGVKEGIYDIVPNLWYTDERAEYMLYGDAYAVNEVKFIKLKGDTFEYDGLASLKGKTVGIARGYGYGDDFYASTDFTRDESDGLMQNIGKLMEGRVDLTLEDKIVASATIKNEDETILDKIEFTEGGMGASNLHIGSGLANPRSKELIDAYNRGLKVIKENGVYEEILNKYGIK